MGGGRRRRRRRKRRRRTRRRRRTSIGRPWYAKKSSGDPQNKEDV